MTLYGDLADSVKWKLCEFVNARPAGGDSNIEYDFALEIIQMVKGQIARGILEIGIPELPQGHEDNPTFIAIRTAQEVMRLRAAAKARGNKE